MGERLIFEKGIDETRTARMYGKDSGDHEIYIDGAWGFMFAGAVIKTTLFTVVPSEDPNIERREVVTRLVMPTNVLFALRDFLDEQCKALEGMGVVQKTETNEKKSKPITKL